MHGCRILGKTGMQEAIPYLEEMSQHHNINVSRIAKESLFLIKNDRFNKYK
jgi:HEAT repeat protein